MMTPPPHRKPIVVIGGGITGAFAAYFLAREGGDVVLVERAGIGGQASGHNPGGINPMHGTGIPGPLHAFALQSFQLHAAHWPGIRDLSGMDFSPAVVPRIHLALEESDLAGLERIHALHNATAGFSARWLSRDELPALDPRLNAAALRGLWTEGNAKVSSRDLTRAVAAAAQKLGAKIVHAEVRALEGSDGCVQAVATDTESIPCSGVILATGPWVAQVAQWTGIRISLEPIKGELLLVRTAGASVKYSFAWREAAVYGTGAQEIWLGGNEEHAGFDCTTTDSARGLILDRVRRLMPGIGIESVIRQIAALRPVTADDIPIIGLAPGWKNVCLAYGGGRKGMLYGAGMGFAAAEVASSGRTKFPIEACSPARFAAG